MMANENSFETWVIYENPKDYPGKFVLRRWIGERPVDPPQKVSDDLKACRDAVPIGLVPMAPAEGDDPCIKYVYI